MFRTALGPVIGVAGGRNWGNGTEVVAMNLGNSEKHISVLQEDVSTPPALPVLRSENLVSH